MFFADPRTDQFLFAKALTDHASADLKKTTPQLDNYSRASRRGRAIEALVRTQNEGRIDSRRTQHRDCCGEEGEGADRQ